MSKLFVTHTSHLVRGPDGAVYAENTLLARSFWTRYLSVFDTVRVAARVRRADRIPDHAQRADGEGVEFADLPDYRGPWEYAARRKELSAALAVAMEGCDAFCLRVPCAIATRVWKLLRRRGAPFGLEVVGDPRESLAAGGVKSVVRPIARALAARDLRRECRAACAVAYVTRETLQRRYPASPGAFTTHYSSIELPPEALVAQARTDFAGASRLIFVGSLAVLYKGPDVLLRAVAKCQHLALKVVLLGDGRERRALEELARELGAAIRVSFRGQLAAGEAVRAELDAADLFVLPSRADALPRALIEAMARGLPCIGTRVGGVPELLDEDDLVTPGSVDELVTKIEAMLTNPARMVRASARNLERAREYLSPVLTERRTAFYREVLHRSRCGDRHKDMKGTVFRV